MAIITEYRIIQSTRELLSKKTQNIEELVGEEYSYTVQSQIDNNGKNYYPIFTVNASDVIAIYDRQTGKMNYTFGGIVSNDDIENTWVTYYSDVLPSTSDMSDYAVMTQDTSSARLKFGTSLDNIVNIVEEDEDVDFFSINIETGSMSESFFTFGSVYSPSCSVEMTNCPYAIPGMYFKVEFEIDGVWTNFGTFLINEIPQKTSEQVSFRGVGLLESVLSVNDGKNYFVPNPTLPEIISTIKDNWGISVVIDFVDELMAIDNGNYWNNARWIRHYQTKESDANTYASEISTYSPRELLSQIAVALHANVIERNGIIHISRFGQINDNNSSMLIFDEDCYSDEPQDNGYYYCPYPVKVASKRMTPNYSSELGYMPYYLDEDATEVTILDNYVSGNANIISYPVTIDAEPLWPQITNISERYWGALAKYPFRKMVELSTLDEPIAYKPFEVEFIGYHPCLYAGSRIRLEYNGKVEELVYIGNLSISWDGGITMSVSTPCDVQITGNTSSASSGSQSSSGVGNITSTITNIINGGIFNDGSINGSKIKDATLDGKTKIKDASIDFAKIDDAFITDLIADSVFAKELTATVADIDTLTADDAIIKNIFSENIISDEAVIKVLQANVIDADVIRSATAEFGYITVDEANIKYATIENLRVLEKEVADEIEADRADIKELNTDVGNINTLIFGSAGGSVIQSSFSNAVVAQIGDAQIKSAMIKDLVASKITSGDILTNNVRVLSKDGSLVISDETIQISDDNRVRVQIGKDASNDYSINIWDANGKLMFSEGGITEDAVKKSIIRDDMVSETANISAGKLNIASLFEEINGSTETIKSTRVYLDDKEQTLDVAFMSMSDTLGYTKKNLLKNTATSKTEKGVTFTVNEDKSVTMNGTATANIYYTINTNLKLPIDNYILSGCGESKDSNTQLFIGGKSVTIYGEYKEKEFSVNGNEETMYVNIYISSGTTVNDTFYPMIRKADIEDSTYEPYVDSVSDTLTSQGTTLSVLQGQISSKIWQQDITTAVDNIEIGGRNLIVLSTMTDGYRMGGAGENYASVNSCLTDYIPVHSDGNLIFTVYEAYTQEFDTYWQLVFYTEDKTFISRPLMDNANTSKKTSWIKEIPSNAAYVRASFPISVKSKVKLEYGTKATDWTPAPEDVATDISALSTKYSTLEQSLDGFKTEVGATYATLDDVATEVSSVRTIAEQTADKFSWIVEGGTSSSNFTLTDRMAKLTAEIISLNGDVKVSGDMLVDGSITAEKLDVEDLFAEDISITGSFYSEKITSTNAEKITTGYTIEGDKIVFSEDYWTSPNVNGNYTFHHRSYNNSLDYRGLYIRRTDYSSSKVSKTSYALDRISHWLTDLDGNVVSGAKFTIDCDETVFDGTVSAKGYLNGYLKSYSTRPTNLDMISTGTGGLYKYVVGSSCATGKPSRDAHVLHCAWDSTDGWDTQLALLNGGTTAGLQIRGQNAGTWGDWYTFLHSGNFTSYAAPANTAKGIMVTCAKALNLTTSWALIRCGANQASGDYSEYYTVIAGSVQVKQAGTYMISAQGYFTTGFTVGDILHIGVGINSDLGLYDNGVPAISANPYMDISPSMIIRNLNAGDIVSIYARNEAAARGTVATGNRTRLSIIKIN